MKFKPLSVKKTITWIVTGGFVVTLSHFSNDKDHTPTHPVHGEHPVPLSGPPVEPTFIISTATANAYLTSTSFNITPEVRQWLESHLT